MENPTTKVIHIQEFDFNRWFEDLKKFEISQEFRRQKGWHAIEEERGFYYVLGNIKDLTMVKEILKYICSVPDWRAGNFAKLIEKNKKLVMDYYMMLSNNTEAIFTDEAERLEMQTAIRIHANNRHAVCTQLRNCYEPNIILHNILQLENKPELAWRLTVFRTYYPVVVGIKTNIIEEIMSQIHGSEDYRYCIKRLETLGADIAFFTRTLTPRMADIFRAPFRRCVHNGWHEIYCETMFTRLIFPILNVIEQEPDSNINHDVFVNLMLCFFEKYQKRVLKMLPNQLITVFKLLARYDDTVRLRRFLACLERLGVN